MSFFLVLQLRATRTQVANESRSIFLPPPVPIPAVFDSSCRYGGSFSVFFGRPQLGRTLVGCVGSKKQLEDPLANGDGSGSGQVRNGPGTVQERPNANLRSLLIHGLFIVDRLVQSSRDPKILL